MHYLRVFIAITFSTFLLVGCGGGGGGGADSSSSVTGSTATTTLSGLAAKGLVSGASVQAYEVVSGTLVAIGSTKTTDANGQYTLSDIPTTENPVVIKVSHLPGATYLDELTGLLVPLPSDFVIRSTVIDLKGPRQVSVNPFTELAVSAAESTGFLDINSISVAKLMVINSIGGLNPFTTNPINSLDNATVAGMDDAQAKLMYLLSSIAKNAQSAACLDGTSGISCSLSSLRSKLKIKKADDGNFVPVDGPGLKSYLDLQLAAFNPNELGGEFKTRMMTTTVITSEPKSINPQQAIYVNSLDGFIDALRKGLNKALDALKSRADSMKEAYSNRITSSVGEVSFVLNNVLGNCPANANGILICSTGSHLNGPIVTFTNATSGYTFEFTDPVANLYKYKGSISGALLSNNASLLINLNVVFNDPNQNTGEQISSNMSLQISGVDSSTTRTITISEATINRFVIKSQAPLMYGTDSDKINLKNFKITRSDAYGSRISAAGELNFVATNALLSTKATGTLSELKLKKIQVGSLTDYWPESLVASLNIDDGNGELLGLNINLLVDQSTLTNPWVSETQSNYSGGTLALGLKFVDQSKLMLSFARTGFDTVAISLTISPDIATSIYDLKFDLTGKRNTLTSKLETSDDGIVVSGWSNYKLILKKSTVSGEFEGVLFDGANKIGLTDHNKLYIGTDANSGRVVSLN